MSIRLAPSESTNTPRLTASRMRQRALALANRRESWALFDQGVVSATNFLTNVLVAKFCLPHNFGIFYLAISLIHFVRGIQEQLVSAPYTIYWHRRDPAQAASFTGSTLIHQLVLLAITLVSLVGLLLLVPITLELPYFGFQKRDHRH